MKNNLLPIAKEGWNNILYAVLAFLFFTIADFDTLSFLSFLVILFLVYVYRNPERETPVFEELSVISPVDGVVLSIEEIDDSEYAYKVKIDSSYLNVSVLRVPFTSNVEKFTLTHGARISRFSSLSNKLNENSEVIFEDKKNNKIKVSHMMKQSFETIKIDLHEQQRVVQGSRYGVMVNGITTIYLPQNFRLNINVGNEVEASQSLVGYFS